MIRRSSLAIALAAGLSLASSAHAFRFGIGDVIETGKLITDATTQPDQDQEREIGQGVAATLLGAAPLLADRAVQEYVNKVGYWVALQSNRPSLPWRFAVLDIDAVNAFAAPGGYIFVTKGLLLNLRNEDELAGVLAHEIAHVMQQHHLKALQSDASLQLGGKVASRAIGVGGLEREALKLIAKGAKVVYSKGLSQDDEFEADRIGVVLAARAGYDPYGLPSVLHTLSSINPGSSGLGLLLKTHPRPMDRMARLDAAMGTRFDSAAARSLIRQRYFASLASIAGMPVIAAPAPQAVPAVVVASTAPPPTVTPPAPAPVTQPAVPVKTAAQAATSPATPAAPAPASSGDVDVCKLMEAAGAAQFGKGGLQIFSQMREGERATKMRKRRCVFLDETAARSAAQELHVDYNPGVNQVLFDHAKKDIGRTRQLTDESGIGLAAYSWIYPQEHASEVTVLLTANSGMTVRWVGLGTNPDADIGKLREFTRRLATSMPR